jgi:hypothetical protein
MAANNNIFTKVVVRDGQVLATPKYFSLPCRNAIVYDITNADAPLASSEYRFFFGGVERIYQLDKTAFTIHQNINGAAGGESGAES